MEQQETLLGAIEAENEVNTVNTEVGEPATAKINEAEIQVMAARIERISGELELVLIMSHNAKNKLEGARAP